MGEIRTAPALQLRIEIGEVAALQQRVVGEVDARRHVLGHERNLLGLGKEIIDDAVEHEPSDAAHRHLFLGNDFGRVEDVEGELVGKGLVEEL
jgi:hypothetical protein